MSDARELGARAGLDQEDVDAFLLEEPGHLGVDGDHVGTAAGGGVGGVRGVEGGAERRERPCDPDIAVAGLLAGPDGESDRHADQLLPEHERLFGVAT